MLTWQLPWTVPPSMRPALLRAVCSSGWPARVVLVGAPARVVRAFCMVGAMPG